MTKWFRIAESTEQRAADRVHDLAALLRMALSSLTDVSSAFSRHALPISFILKQSSPMAGERRRRRSYMVPLSVRRAGYQSRMHAAQRRTGARSMLRSDGHPVVRAPGAQRRCHHSGSGRSNQQVRH
jgi:hypothetical protein